MSDTTTPHNSFRNADIPALAWAVKNADPGASRLHHVKSIREACPQLSLGMAVFIQKLLTITEAPAPEGFHTLLTRACRFDAWNEAHAARAKLLYGGSLNDWDVIVSPIYNGDLIDDAFQQQWVICYKSADDNRYYYTGRDY